VIIASVAGLGALALASVARPELFVLAATALGLAIWGFLTMFSIRLGLIIAAIALGFLTAVAARRQGRLAWIPIGAGSVFIISLSCLILFALVGPSVQCEPTGATVSQGSLGPPGAGSSGAGGEVLVQPSSTVTGYFTSNGRVYHFTCQGTRIVAFSSSP